MCDPITAIIGAGAISGGTGLLSGILGSQASKSAASQQAQAAEQAAQLQAQAQANALAFQEKEFNAIQQNLQPYMQLGQQGIAQLTGQLPQLTKNVVQPLQLTGPPPSNLALLQQTPGYQFTLQQGLQATQNSYAGQGLGRSGAALKGAAQYAENLAATTYQQQFQDWLNQNTLQTQVQATTNAQALAQNLQNYNMLSGLVGTGAQAALGQGQFGTALTGQTAQTLQAGAAGIGQGLVGAAAAQAAGTVGSTNAITNALGGISGAGSNTALMLALNNAGLFGTAPSANALNSAQAGALAAAGSYAAA